jgi:hypothetical protein
MNTTQAIRTKVLIGSNPKVVKKDKRQKADDVEKHLKRELTLYEKQYKKQEAQGSRAGLDDAEAKRDGLTLGIQGQSPDEIADRLGPIKAERFDFTMNEQFYALNIEADEYGERLTAKTDQQGRVVSKDGVHKDEPDEYSSDEEEWDDELRRYVPAPKPVIPIEELVHVYYFQWRVDRLSHYTPPKEEEKKTEEK